MPQLIELKPSALWNHFQTLCSIPHPSKHEDAVCQYIKKFSEQKSLEVVSDKAGNLIIRKPATTGMEDRAGIVLQSHLDMVPQKNAETKHDFKVDPIKAYVDGAWVKAEGTTLGADNGIGVAAILAILESTDIEHGPLEALLTVDEEAGMTGAKNLQPDVLKGQILLNLDSEAEGEVYVGCAGGEDVLITMDYQPEVLSEGYKGFSVAVTGLKGGHSGADVHRQRGNANKLLVRLLKALEVHGVRVHSIQGGSLRNAIPREAFAEIAIPVVSTAIAHHCIEELFEVIKAELAEVEPDVNFSIGEREAEITTSLPVDLQSDWLSVLSASPSGVQGMSASVEGVVETSNNLAVINIGAGNIRIENMVRSLIDSARCDLADSICDLFRAFGAVAIKKGGYPGWKPNMDSSILKIMIETHQSLFGKKPTVKVIHAGLECGLLGTTYPHWDMISFGPTINFAHSPDERVNILSVVNFWDYLRTALKNAPLA